MSWLDRNRRLGNLSTIFEIVGVVVLLAVLAFLVIS